MKILFASRCLPYPVLEGDRLILHHLLTESRARGHECDVVALSQRPEDADERERSAALCHDLDVVEEQPRSPMQYLARLARPFPRTAEACWNPGMWRAIARRVASVRYDVAHVFGGIQVYELREAVGGLPVVITPYESHSLFLQRARADARTLTEWMRVSAALAVTRRYERVMYAGYDRVVTISDVDRHTLRGLAPSLPITVIPLGVRADAFAHERERPTEPLLAFLGNYAFLPNVRAATALVRDVLPRVQQAIPAARVLLIGANPPPSIAALAGGDVEVTGWVPDVARQLARARVFVAPMSQGAGIKDKILEAMAAGLPVVTTTLGCDGLDVREGIQVLCRQDPAALADAVVSVLRDPALGARLGAAARQFVREHHSWTSVADRYDAVYREVIARRSPR